MPKSIDSWHMKVVRLSALHTGRLYPQQIAWYSLLLEAELTPGPVRLEGLSQWKISVVTSREPNPWPSETFLLNILFVARRCHLQQILCTGH